MEVRALLPEPGDSGDGCAAIVLAAGAGTRMGAEVPKPLHLVAGRAMVLRVIDAVAAAVADPIVVVIGHRGAEVRSAIEADASAGPALRFARQENQRGTGDAVQTGLAALVGVDGAGRADEAGEADVLVVPGDAPLLRAETLAEVIAARRRHGAAASLLTAQLDDPSGYGRIVRTDLPGSPADSPTESPMRTPTSLPIQIIEERDATEAQRQIREINAGVYCFETSRLQEALTELRPVNDQAELYLTDAIGILSAAGSTVVTVAAQDSTEAMGVNDSAQLAACTEVLQARPARPRVR